MSCPFHIFPLAHMILEWLDTWKKLGYLLPYCASLFLWKHFFPSLEEMIEIHVSSVTAS